MTHEQRQSMPPSKVALSDSVTAVLGKLTGKDWRRSRQEKLAIGGNVVVELFGPDGEIKYREVGENLVTDAGDENLTKRIATGDTEEIATGMKLGTGVTAASKAGAGSLLVTYEGGSQEALDTSPPATSDKGAGAGYRVTYICTWIAGDVIEAALAEVILSHETPITDVTDIAADVIARFVFASTIDKQAGDSLVVTWNVDLLGA